MKYILGFVFCFVVGVGALSSQHFPVDYPANLTKFPFIHSSYILEKKITSIETEVMFKSPMKTIEYSKERLKIDFGTDGFPSYRRTISSLGDTTEFWYENEKGILISERVKTAHRDVRIKYLYNDHGDLVLQTETDTKTGIQFKNEVFKYVYSYHDQYKKYWLNDEGLSYKYSIIKLDEKNRIIEERGRHVIGSSRHSVYYVYKGDQLIDYSSNVRTQTRREMKFKLHYDELGRVSEMNEYKDGAYVHHHEFLYENNYLTAILEKNIRTQKIKIIKFRTK